MELRLVQIFCRVYEAKSFSKAAASLGLAQPTVSEHVKKLETALGVPLFDRTTREVRATRAGEHLYQLSRGLAEVERRIEEGMARFLGEDGGEVAVGASSIPGEVLLPRLIAEFRRKEPRVRVTMSVRGTRAVLDDLASGGIDVAFVGHATKEPGLKCTRFATDRLVLVVPAGGRWKDARSLTLEQLRAEPLLVREAGSGTRTAFEERLQERGLSLADFKVAAELGSTTAIKEAVKQGVGVSVVSDLSVRPDVAAGKLRVAAVRGLGELRRDFFVVKDARRPPSAACERFIQHVTSSASSRPRRSS